VKQDAQRRLVIPPGSAKGCPHCGQWIAAYLSGWGTWATQKVGITQVLISAYEADRCYFSVEMAVRFALVLRARFSGRILPIDAGVSDRWGLLAAEATRRGKTLATIDALLAATAFHFNLTIVSRNANDFAPTSVPFLNPWEA
jgi:predicted nucleic acid-binding protein